MAGAEAASAALAGDGGAAPTPEPRRSRAKPDDDVCGAAFNAERRTAHGADHDEGSPRARRFGALAARGAVFACVAAALARLASTHPRTTLALLVVAATASRWLQARAL